MTQDSDFGKFQATYPLELFYGSWSRSGITDVENLLGVFTDFEFRERGVRRRALRFSQNTPLLLNTDLFFLSGVGGI